MNTPWYERLVTGSYDADYFETSNLVQQAFFATSIARGMPVLQEGKDMRGTLKKNALKQLETYLTKHNFTCILRDRKQPGIRKLNGMWFNDDSYLRINFNEYGNLNYNIKSFNEDQVAEIDAWWKKNFKPRPEEEPINFGNYIHMLIKTTQGFGIHRAAWIEEPFIRDNYVPQVRQDFDRIVEELGKDKPRGKLTIIDGPPGTGKSYMIRSIISSAYDAKFVLISPDIFDQLDNPDLLPVLLTERMSNPGTPVVLVLEDADKMLSQRMEGNIAAISTALNMGDGILGDALNVRIIASTNIPIKDIDPAVTRRGRMSVRSEVGALDIETANAIWQRDGGAEHISKKAMPEGGWTLADVYDMTYEFREDEEKAKEKKSSLAEAPKKG